MKKEKQFKEESKDNQWQKTQNDKDQKKNFKRI